MQSEWQIHLGNQQATIHDGMVTDFGHPKEEMAAINANIIADLSHYGLISAEGADSEVFLQGQFSNDVRLVTADRSQLSAYCNPKGRILASFRLFFLNNKYYLQLPATLLEPTLKRLRMFVMRSQVSLQDASDDLVRFGLAGPDSERLLKSAGLIPPTGVDETCLSDKVLVLRIPGIHPRFELHGPVGELVSLWDRLAGEARPVGAVAWSLLDIRAGLPVIQNQTVESFVPQMVNLELINGVSFKKGCYTGQEIVARMQYLGKLKKRMYRVHITTDSPVQPGDPLYSGSSDNPQSIGNIVNAQPDPNGGFEALAVIQITEAEQGEVRLGDKNGSILEIIELPYSLSA